MPSSTYEQRTLWQLVVLDKNGTLVDLPQADVKSIEVERVLNGGSGSGTIKFARPFNNIGALGFTYQFLLYFWPAGTTRPDKPYWAGTQVDPEQVQQSQSGEVTVNCDGDFKLLDAALFSAQINPDIDGNPSLDAGKFLYSIITQFQPASFNPPVVPTVDGTPTMFNLLPMQWTHEPFAQVIDDITQQGRDTTGALYVWVVKTNADGTRHVEIDIDQDPNVVSGVTFRHLFVNSQIGTGYQITTKYRDIANVVAVYGSQDPQTGALAFGVYEDATSISELGRAIEAAVTETYLYTEAACAAFGEFWLDQNAYPTAQGQIPVIRPDPTLDVGVWVQVWEAPATATGAASIKQVRTTRVQVQIEKDRVEQTLYTDSPTPYLDKAIYDMGTEIKGSVVRSAIPITVNRQTLYIRSGGMLAGTETSTDTGDANAGVALTSCSAAFPSGVVALAALAMTELVDNSGGANNGQGGDGQYTVFATSSATWVIVKGDRPANSATQQAVLGVQVVDGVPYCTDARTLSGLPGFSSALPSLDLQSGTEVLTGDPANAGAGAYNQPIDFHLDPSVWTSANPSFAYLLIGAIPHGSSQQITTGTTASPTSDGHYIVSVLLGAGGTGYDVYAVAYDNLDQPTQALLLCTTAANPVAIGVGNVNIAADLAAPTTASVSVTNGATPTSLVSDVAVSLSCTNVPTDGSAYGVAFYFRTNGSSTWTPYSVVTLAGLPTPSGTQTIATDLGQMANGVAIDIGVGYVGLGGYGPITTIATDYTPEPLVVSAPYLIGSGVAAAPSVTSISIASGLSANGVSAGVTLTFTITNQPTDGSLQKIAIYNRVTGSGTAYAKYMDVPAVGVGESSPSASGTYADIQPNDLTNGQGYDWAIAFENVQGNSSALTDLGSSTAVALDLPTSSLPAMPSGLTVTATGTIFSYIAAGTTSYYAQFDVLPVVTPPSGDPRPFAAWGAGFYILAKVNNTGSTDGDTTITDYAIVANYPTTSWANGTTIGSSGSPLTTSALGAGNAYQLAIAPYDQTGTIGPLAIFALTNPSQLNLGVNLIPDASFSQAAYNSSGYASSDPLWNSYGMTETPPGFYFRSGADATHNPAPGQVNFIAIDSSYTAAKHYAQSEVISVVPGQTYVLQGCIDAREATNAGGSSGKPYWAIASTDLSTVYDYAYQDYGTGSATSDDGNLVSVEWTCPTGVTQVTIIMHPNGCGVSSSGTKQVRWWHPKFALGTAVTAWTDGPGLAGATPASAPPATDPISSAASSGGGAASSDFGVNGGGGSFRYGSAPIAVQTALDSSGNVLNVDGIEASTIGPPAAATLQASPGSDGSYLAGGVVSNRHLQSEAVDGTQAYPDIYSTQQTNVDDNATTWDTTGGSGGSAIAANTTLSDAEVIYYNVGSSSYSGSSSPRQTTYDCPAGGSVACVFKFPPLAGTGKARVRIAFTGQVSGGTNVEDYAAVAGQQQVSWGDYGRVVHSGVDYIDDFEEADGTAQSFAVATVVAPGSSNAMVLALSSVSCPSDSYGYSDITVTLYAPDGSVIDGSKLTLSGSGTLSSSGAGYSASGVTAATTISYAPASGSKGAGTYTWVVQAIAHNDYDPGFYHASSYTVSFSGTASYWQTTSSSQCYVLASDGVTQRTSVLDDDVQIVQQTSTQVRVVVFNSNTSSAMSFGIGIEVRGV